TRRARGRMTTIEVAGRRIGDGTSVFLIAEAGVNHNGDLGLALELVAAAADARADAVKFQTFDPGELASAAAPLAEYQRSADAGSDGGQIEMLSRLRLADSAFEEVAARCAERNVIFLSTPFDERSADLLERIDVAAFKIGSGELTNSPFLRDLAR